MIAIDSALRVLVIGAGPASAALHLPALARLRDRGRITLDHLVDLDSGRAAAACRDFGFREHSGTAASALERKDFDAVYILGSAQMHYDYGLLALRSGKHLFVEKPIAPCYVQALELAQTARDHGLIAVGGLNRRFQRALAAVRARRQGRLAARRGRVPQTRACQAAAVRCPHLAHRERHSCLGRPGIHDGRSAR